MKIKYFTIIELVIVTVVIAALAWFLLPPLGTTPEYIKESIRSASILKSIHMGMLLYEEDNFNFYPDQGFRTIIEQGYLDKAISQFNPNDKSKEISAIEGLINNHNFVYLGNGKKFDTSLGEKEIYIIEPMKKNMKCANVVFTSGCVKSIMRKEWNDMCVKYKIPSIYKIEN